MVEGKRFNVRLENLFVPDDVSPGDVGSDGFIRGDLPPVRCGHTTTPILVPAAAAAAVAEADGGAEAGLAHVGGHGGGSGAAGRDQCVALLVLGGRNYTAVRRELPPEAIAYLQAQGLTAHAVPFGWEPRHQGRDDAHLLRLEV